MRHALEEYIRKLQVTEGQIRFQPEELYRQIEPEFRAKGYREGDREAILLVRMDAIGDMVLTSGVIRELRKNYPKAYLMAVCTPLVYPLLEYCPYLDEVRCFDLNRLRKDFMETFLSLMDFCETFLWKHRFSLCVCPQWGDPKELTFLLAYMSGANRRAGFSGRVSEVYLRQDRQPDSFEKHFMTECYVTPPEILNEAERHITLLKLMGLKVKEDRTEIWLREADKAYAERVMTGKFNIVIGLGSGDRSRKYPTKRYIEVMKKIKERLDAEFYIVGGKEEMEDGQYAAELTGGRNLCMQASLRETAAVVARADMYLGNDTGTMHIAAAAGTPIVYPCREAKDKTPVLTGLFSNYKRFEPWKVPYRTIRPEHARKPCDKKNVYGGCAVNASHCILGVSVDEVVEAFFELKEEIYGNRAER